MMTRFPVDVVLSMAPRTLPHLPSIGLEPHQLARRSLVAQALYIEFGDAAVQSSVQRLGDGRQIPVPLGKDGDLRLSTTAFGTNDKIS